MLAARELQAAIDSLRAYTLAQYCRNLQIDDTHGQSARVVRCSIFGTVLPKGALRCQSTYKLLVTAYRFACPADLIADRRYHSLSTPDADRSASAHTLLVGIRHELQWALLNSIPGASDVSGMLLSKLPGLLDWVVPETTPPAVFIPVVQGADGIQDTPVFFRQSTYEYTQPSGASCTDRARPCFADVLRQACLAYGNRPLFGRPQPVDAARSSVPSELRIDGSGALKWESFSEVLSQADRIARGISRMVASRTIELAGSASIGPYVGILSEVRPGPCQSAPT